MAGIPTFDARAPRSAPLQVSNDTGAVDAWGALAKASGQISARIGQMADRAAIREGRDAGAAAALQVTMPGVDFAFDGKSAATSVAGKSAPNASALKSYLMTKHGVSDFRAAAILGHLQQESGLRASGAVGDNGTAFGLAQWRNERFEALKTFASSQGKDWQNEELQLDFIMHELGTTEARAGSAFNAATNLEEATAAFMSFERPAGWTVDNPRGGHAWNQRLANAQAIMGDAAHGTPPVAADPTQGNVQVLLTGTLGAVPQTRPGTLYGEAYNAAADGIYLNRVDTSMRLQMDALAIQHENDPAALDQALLALRQGYVDEQPPEIAARLDQSFQTTRLGLQRQAVARFNRNLEEQSLAAFEENVNARITGALRIAAKGGYDGTADAALAFELEGIGAQIDGSSLSPLQKSRMKQAAAQDLWSARIMGSFEDLPDETARAAFAQQLETDWQNGEGLGARLDQKSFDAVRNQMARRLQADEAAAAKRAAALDKSIDAQLSYLKKGWPVPAEMRESLRQEVAATGDAALAANLDFLDGLAGWQQAHVAAPPAVLDAQIAALRGRIAREGITPAADTTLDVMESLRKEMDIGLKTDPLGWASRAGVAAIEPLDFSDGAKLSASLSARTADATAVGRHYGVAPKFFTPTERDGLKKMLASTPLALPSIASALSAGLGSDTPRALAEVSEDAPVLAHVAGLVHATGDQRVAVEIGEALELRRQPGYKSALPSPAKLSSATVRAVDGALALLPATGARVMETAATLLEGRAFARGIGLDDFDTDGSPARTAYLEAVDQVLGARTIGGVKHGGLTDVNGFTTIAPPDMPADELQDVLDGLTADDLAAQPPIFAQNGIPVTPRQIRNGRLVMTTPGRYRVALGDVEAGDPRYVASTDGGYFELDIGALRRTVRVRDEAQGQIVVTP